MELLKRVAIGERLYNKFYELAFGYIMGGLLYKTV